MPKTYLSKFGLSALVTLSLVASGCTSHTYADGDGDAGGPNNGGAAGAKGGAAGSDKGGSSAVGSDESRGGSSALKFVSASGGRVAASGGSSGGAESSDVGGSSSSGEGGVSALGGQSSTESIGGASALGGQSSTSSTQPGDETPPTVDRVTPGNGQKGVLKSTQIDITFSEAMNTSSVAEALSVPPIVSSDLQLKWSENDTKLTIIPRNGLAYAAGSNPSAVVAQTYQVTLSTAARDRAGNALTTAFRSSFSTLKSIHQKLSPARVDTSETYGAAVYKYEPASCVAGKEGAVGRFSTPSAGGDRYVFVTFDLSDMVSASTVESVESAAFSATQSTPTDGFYPKASVVLERMGYVNPPTWSTTLADAAESLGTFCSSAVTSPQLEVAASVNAELRASRTGLLFRLVPVLPDDNKYAYFSCNGFALTVRYLAR